MDVLERTSVLLEHALQCCGESLEAAERQSVQFATETSAQSLEQLHSVRMQLLAEPTPGLVDESRQLLRDAFTRISALLAHYAEELQPGVRDAVSSIDQAMHSISEHSLHYGKCLNDAADNIESLGRLRNIGEIHNGISRNVNLLRSNLQEMIRQSHEIIARLEEEKSELESRLQVVEKEALTDALTGLANRRAAERKIQELVARHKTFSVVLLDLDHFKRINDTYGHTAGDQILRLFSSRLRTMVGEGELVGRWGGDEFVVVLVQPLAESLRRSSRFIEALSGEYLIEFKRRKTTLAMSLSSGVAEHLPGESAECLVQRSDEILYANKLARSA